MMRIFHRSNNAAYTLLDSIISVFIVSITLVTVLVLLRINVQISKKTSDQIENLSIHQNEKSEIIFELCE